MEGMPMNIQQPVKLHQVLLHAPDERSTQSVIPMSLHRLHPLS